MRNNLAIVITARPSYAKFKPVIQALIDIGVTPDIYACASTLLDRYGFVVGQIVMDFPKLEVIPVHSVTEGSFPISSVLSTGTLVSALGTVFNLTKPALVCVMADRHETLAVSIVAAYQNIPVAHFQGGEVSGNIDDKVRNANTMLADYHFPATRAAAYHVSVMTRQEYPQVFHYGCPSIDVARMAKDQMRVSNTELGGDGPLVDLDMPFATVLYHAEEGVNNYSVMIDILQRLHQLTIPVVAFWPGNDAGMEGISKAIREQKVRDGDFRTVRTLPPERFLKLMTQTAALVGNSSVGIRECSYLGTPVFNVGGRQQRRERASNVKDGFPQDDSWLGRRIPSTLYGDGYASPKIAAKLKELLCR